MWYKRSVHNVLATTGGPCVTPDTVSQTVLFPDLFDKPLVATFDEQHASSDGGGILLKAAERVYGLVKAFAGCLTDKRAPEKIRHTLADVIGQRIFGIACGHPDGNDADHARRRPHPQAAARAGPGDGRALGVATDDLAVRERRASHRPLPDGTGVGGLRRSSGIGSGCTGGRGVSRSTWTRPTTGRTARSNSSFFNGHYGAWCYLPQLAFLTFDREVERICARRCCAVYRKGGGL